MKEGGIKRMVTRTNEGREKRMKGGKNDGREKKDGGGGGQDKYDNGKRKQADQQGAWRKELVMADL